LAWNVCGKGDTGVRNLFCEIWREKRQLEDLGVDGRILKLIYKIYKQGV